MITWRKVLSLGVLGSLLTVGCVVKSSTDDGTGGSSSFGGMGGASTGGTTTGGTTTGGTGGAGGVLTPITAADCPVESAKEPAGSCGACIVDQQCELFVTCMNDPKGACMPAIDSMSLCIFNAWKTNGGDPAMGTGGFITDTDEADCAVGSGVGDSDLANLYWTAIAGRTQTDSTIGKALHNCATKCYLL